MILTIVKIEKKKSRYGGMFFYVFFKSPSNTKSYFSCIYTKMRNYKRWEKVLDCGTTLSNLHLVKGKRDNLVDADSKFRIVKEQE